MIVVCAVVVVVVVRVFVVGCYHFVILHVAVSCVDVVYVVADDVVVCVVIVTSVVEDW